MSIAGKGYPTYRVCSFQSIHETRLETYEGLVGSWRFSGSTFGVGVGWEGREIEKRSRYGKGK